MNDLPQTFAVVASTDMRIDRLYKPILREMVKAGVKVYAIAPPGRSVGNIERAGAQFVPWHLDRRSLNPFSNFMRLLDLMRIYSRIKPDVVHHYTVKPNLYGALAAWCCAVPVTFTGVTGLGQVFSPGGWRQKILRVGVLMLYRRIAATLSDRLIFQTEHDIDVLLGKGVAKDKAQVVSGGAGVDIRYFDSRNVSAEQRERLRAELKIPRDAPVVLMASRLLYEKGVGEYVNAARLVKAADSTVRFLLAGERDAGNYGSVRHGEVERWREEAVVDFMGYRHDMRDLLAIADIVVHPTYYPEGIPRVLIEAASMGKPIVSTSIPGVEQVLVDNVNGIVVPPRDVGATAVAIETLLTGPALRAEYGSAGRRLAEKQYDSRMVVRQHLAQYRAAWREFMYQDGTREALAEPAASTPATAAPASGQPACRSRDEPEPAPRLSVIMPVRNADDTLAQALDSVLSQDYDGDIEVIVADGSGTAETAEIVSRRPSVRIVANPRKTIGFGINLAIQEASGDILLRCDAHSFLPEGYMRRAVETLRRTGAANVGGRQVPVGTTFFQRAVAIAMTSPIGAGDARYRLGGKEGPVDTVYLGTFRRDALAAVGGFDPSFLHNQDYEVNWRLREGGELVWFDPELTVEYRPRSTLQELARQYFHYGRWKSAVLFRHPGSLRSRHLAAPALLLGLIATVLTMVFHRPWLPWAASFPLCYVLALAVWALVEGLRRRTAATLAFPLALVTMHVCWALGFFLPARRRATDAVTKGLQEPSV